MIYDPKNRIGFLFGIIKLSFPNVDISIYIAPKQPKRERIAFLAPKVISRIDE